MTVSEKDCEGRMDLRALPIFTIDSAETKDIDDAISLTRTPEGGFELGVHIADGSTTRIRWCPCCPRACPTASAR